MLANLWKQTGSVLCSCLLSSSWVLYGLTTVTWSKNTLSKLFSHNLWYLLSLSSLSYGIVGWFYFFVWDNVSSFWICIPKTMKRIQRVNIICVTVLLGAYFSTLNPTCFGKVLFRFDLFIYWLTVEIDLLKLMCVNWHCQSKIRRR